MSNPENSSYSGVVITAIVQFSMDMTIEKYLDTWNSLSNNDQELLEWKISDTKLESKLTSTMHKKSDSTMILAILQNIFG